MSTETREDPFFLVGDSRSGTTYLANILVHHPRIGLAPESKFVLSLLDAFDEAPIRDAAELDGALERIYREKKFLDFDLERADLEAELSERLPVTFAEATRLILRRYCDREYPGRPVWGLKKGGGYILDAPRLLKHFPRARFVHILRDGRAVFSSKKKAIHSGSGKPMASNAIRAAEVWTEFVTAFDALHASHPENTLEVSYERLLTDMEDVLTGIFRFLDLDVDPGLVARAQASLDPSYVVDRSRYLHDNVAKPPLTDRIDAWRTELSEQEVRTYEMVAGSTLARKGYAVTDGRASPVASMTYLLRRSARVLQRLLT